MELVVDVWRGSSSKDHFSPCTSSCRILRTKTRETEKGAGNEGACTCSKGVTALPVLVSMPLHVTNKLSVRRRRIRAARERRGAAPGCPFRIFRRKKNGRKEKARREARGARREVRIRVRNCHRAKSRTLRSSLEIPPRLVFRRKVQSTSNETLHIQSNNDNNKM